MLGTVVDDSTVTDAAEPPADAVVAPRGVSATTVVTFLLAIVAVRLGMRPLSDNSFLTHLETGRLILDQRRVPTADPYSFSAHGEPWTVQSWLASVIYAVTERIGGLALIRVLVSALLVALTLTIWRLTRPAGSLVARFVPMAFVIGLGTVFWSERPLLFGLLGLALVLRAAEDDLDPRWLVPIMWVWVNTHGSFPFAPGVLVLLALGRRLDGAHPRVELRALAWTMAGIAVAAINPIGPRLLIFPLSALEHREAFTHIVEWMPLAFDSWIAWLFTAQVLLAVVLLLSRARSWRMILPLLAFAGSAFLSRRNVAPASVVVAFAAVPALAGLGSLTGTEPRRSLRPVAATLAVVGLVVGVAGWQGPDLDLGHYPVAATRWADQQHLFGSTSRVLAPDYVGNFLGSAYGPDGVRVFVDDRVDMYPVDVIIDGVDLHRSDEDVDFGAIVGRIDPTVVIWELDSDFGRWLEAQPRWTTVERDGWLVAVPAE